VEAEAGQAHSIRLLAGRVAGLEKTVAGWRMAIPTSYSKAQLSDEIPPAQPP